jgi:hypothetical protein
MGWDGMARAGRKRKNVPRLAGRIDWRAEREDPTLTATWSRAREAFLEFGKNPFLASQAGRAYVFRQLTAVEAEAAKRWAEMLVTNRRVIIGQTGNIHGSALDRAGAGLSRERDPEWIEEFRQRFDEMQAIILQAGKPALSALNRLCRDEASTAALPQAKLALAQLVVHFRLDSAADR